MLTHKKRCRMFDRFLNKLFGIMKRTYYLLAVIFAIPITIICTIGAIQHKGTSDVIGCLIFGLLVLPAARLFHIAAHWVVWGKINN